MTTKTDPDGTWNSAHPVVTDIGVQHYGLSARQYAAIHLLVPDTGDDWLDEMIRKRLRDYFAAKAMQAAATNPVGADGFTFGQRAEWAYQQADAMLAQREKQ